MPDGKDRFDDRGRPSSVRGQERGTRGRGYSSGSSSSSSINSSCGDGKW